MRDFSTRPRAASHALRDGALLAVAVVLGLFAVREAVEAGRGLSREREIVRTLRADIAAEEVRVARAGSSRALGRRAGVLSARVLLTATAPPHRVVAELAALLPADVRLKDLTLRYGEGLQLEMTVEARSPDAYDRFLDRVEGSPLFTGVIPGAERREGSVSVTLRAAYRAEGAL